MKLALENGNHKITAYYGLVIEVHADAGYREKRKKKKSERSQSIGYISQVTLHSNTEKTRQLPATKNETINASIMH